MRILLYGMQSSGASMLAFTLAQRPGSLAFVDVWNTFAAPELGDIARDVVAKLVVTTAYSLAAHRRRFRPDLTLLVLRHPVDNYYSLSGKTYANENGLMDEKFSLLEQVFRDCTEFDQVLHYEDFAFCPGDLVDTFERMGWKVGYDALLFQRAQREIQKANRQAFPGIDERLKYGLGNIDSNGLLRDRVRFSQPWGRTAHLPALCPSMFEHYTALRAGRGKSWNVPSRALLSSSLHPVLRELNGTASIPRASERLGYRLQFAGGTPQCRITDTEVALFPATRGRETRLALSGLPGQPFNRLCGAVFGEHPLGLGTATHLRIEAADEACLAEEQFTLRHSQMQNFEMKYEPGDAAMTLILTARLAGGVESATHSGVCFRDLRLEQAAV